MQPSACDPTHAADASHHTQHNATSEAKLITPSAHLDRLRLGILGILCRLSTVNENFCLCGQLLMQADVRSALFSSDAQQPQNAKPAAAPSYSWSWVCGSGPAPRS